MYISKSWKQHWEKFPQEPEKTSEWAVAKGSLDISRNAQRAQRCPGTAWSHRNLEEERLKQWKRRLDSDYNWCILRHAGDARICQYSSAHWALSPNVSSLFWPGYHSDGLQLEKTTENRTHLNSLKISSRNQTNAQLRRGVQLLCKLAWPLHVARVTRTKTTEYCRNRFGWKVCAVWEGRPENHIRTAV